MTKTSRKRNARIRARKTEQYFLPIEPTIIAEGDGPPRFAIEAYKGDSALSVRGFDKPVVIELKTASFEKPVTKINRNHEQDREVGHATEQRIDTTGIYFEGVLSVPGRDREEIVEAASNGFPWDASIEAVFPRAELVPKGRHVTVNGKRFSGVYVARHAVLTGVAILNRGADRQTSVAIAAKHKEIEMDQDLKLFIEAEGFDPDTVAENESQLEHFEAALKDARAKPDDPSPDNPAAWTNAVARTREKNAAEAQRCNEISTICAKFNNPEIEVKEGEVVSLEAHAIRTGMTAKETTLEAKLFELEAKSAGNGYTGPAIHQAGRNDENAEVIECAMALASNVSTGDMERNRWFNENIINEAMKSRYRGYRVSRLAYQTMAAAGIYHPPGQLDDQYINAAVRAHQKLQASGFTTLSLPGIMSNVANKTLLAAYTRSDSMIPFCFGQASASDFKPLYSYQLEGSGMLEKLGPTGEIKHGALVESEYTKQLETFAKMLSFTRTDLINDDMSALTRVSSMLGTMAFKAREFQAMQTIANSTIFHTDNGNLLTANPLSIDGLTASGVAFDAQTDTDGLPIGIDGARILAPTSLKVVTSQLINQTEIRDNLTDAKVFINNPHAGTFSGFNTQWADNALASAVAGTPDVNRSNTWYRFADPAAAPAFEVVYLNGNSSPTIQSAESSFNQLGMEWRCYFDFGFGEADPKYAQKNVGV